jgi:hypothetical protein
VYRINKLKKLPSPEENAVESVRMNWGDPPFARLYLHTRRYRIIA